MRNVVLKSDVDKRLAGIHGELLARLIDDKGGLCGFSTVLQRSSVCVLRCRCLGIGFDMRRDRTDTDTDTDTDKNSFSLVCRDLELGGFRVLAP